jgi:hypothetical protein
MPASYRRSDDCLVGLVAVGNGHDASGIMRAFVRERAAGSTA